MKTLFSALLALLLMAPLASAQEAGMTPDGMTGAQKTEIEKIVHDYLLKNPEVIREAIQALQAKEEQSKADAQTELVARNKDALFNDPASPVDGNPMGDVTVVEFFDYRCPYCKAVAAPLQKLIEEDKGVRLVMKEFPILGQDSILASQAALASVGQGKYWEFHQALMEHKGQFDMEVIKGIAAKVGLDPAKLEADMQGDKIKPAISANHALAKTLDIGATPTFIIGDQVVEGAVPLEQLKELIKKARGS
ncbi:DsbA family protein [Dongia sp.]|uniref:DsbA family protein n=1 Tax=Dongia sp. TaxID=1977262 RepID=UPI0037509414